MSKRLLKLLQRVHACMAAAVVALSCSSIAQQLTCPAGALSFCNATSRRLEEDSKTHRSAVTCLAWSSSGAFLLSADAKGKVSASRLHRQCCVCALTRMSHPAVIASNEARSVVIAAGGAEEAGGACAACRWPSGGLMRTCGLCWWPAQSSPR